MTNRSYFDHLAIGVEQWAAGFPALISELGGRWRRGGDAGAFAACQLAYRSGLCLELVAPGSKPDEFMDRFLSRSGRGPHHLTFRVFDLNDVLTSITAVGIESVDGPAWPSRRELLLHPRATGMGTLIQIIEVDDEAYDTDQGRPEGFPDPTRDAVSISWIGLTVDSMVTAEALFVDAFDGDVEERAASSLLISWGTRRRLLVRLPGAYPGGPRIWAREAVGVGHIMLGDPNLAPSDPALAAARPVSAGAEIGTPIWSVPT